MRAINNFSKMVVMNIDQAWVDKRGRAINFSPHFLQKLENRKCSSFSNKKNVARIIGPKLRQINRSLPPVSTGKPFLASFNM